MTLNKIIAARADELAAAAPTGSLDRRAAACVAVAYATTRTPAAARRALTQIRIPAVAAAAQTIASQLEAQLGAELGGTPTA